MNNRFLQSLGLAALLAFASTCFVGCASTGGGRSAAAGDPVETVRPAEIVPTPRRSVSTRTFTGAIPITVVKAVPTPSGARARRLSPASVPPGVSIPYFFSVKGVWPEGLPHVDVTVRCYKVNGINPVSTGYQVTTSLPALDVFPGNAVSIRLYDGVTSTLNLTFPSSTTRSQLLVGAVGTATTGQKFQGADIIVVNP